MSPEAPSNADLVRAAQHGDRESFGLLLGRHHAGMRAVALAILGSGPDTEDACQDAIVTAITRIGQLRDPESVGPWLRSIVRNNCRMMLRSRHPIPTGLSIETLSDTEAPDPGRVMEQLGARDWLWSGLEQLRPAVRSMAVLRWFTETNTYEAIAAICGVPIGTVRSRLNEARKQLAGTLPRIADEKHSDAAALTAERYDEAAALLSAVPRGAPLASIKDRWSPRAQLIWPGDEVLEGLPALFDVMHNDYRAGVRYRLLDVVAGAGVTIWHNEFINPPDNPFHCPPSATWLLTEKAGRIAEVRLFRTPREHKESTSA